MFSKQKRYIVRLLVLLCWLTGCHQGKQDFPTHEDGSMPAEESIENSVPKIISLWCLDSEGTETVLNIPVDSTDLNPVIQFEEIFTDLCNNTENLLPEGDALENINENIVSIEFDTYKIWIEWSLLDSAYLSTQYRMTEPAAYMEIHQSEPGIDKYFILSLESEIYQKIIELKEDLISESYPFTNEAVT